MKIMIMREVKIPWIPNYLVAIEEGEDSIHIRDVRPEDLYSIGLQWTKELLAKAESFREPVKKSKEKQDNGK